MKGVRRDVEDTGNKPKPLIDRSRFDYSRFLRWALILVLYLTVFSALDRLSHIQELFPGVVPWYLPDGLSFAFLLTFGVGFIPALTVASLISSLIIFQLSTPTLSILAWAVILPVIYGMNAWFLRKRVGIDPQLKNLRDLVWLILSSAVVTTILAVISISALVYYKEIPTSEYTLSIVHWWIGEMIGVLVLTPFLLVHVMPRLKRFIDGERMNSGERVRFTRPSLLALAQIISIPLVLYLVFGVPALKDFHPFYLIAGPLIWIALTHGFSKVSLANVVMGFGIILSIWLNDFDIADVGEFQFLMFGIFITALMAGAIVSNQKRTEEELRQKETYHQALIENAPDAITLLGSDGLLKYISPSAQRILGYIPDEQIGSNLSDFIHPDDLPGLQTLLRDLSQKPGAVAITQYRFWHHDGSWRWLESTITNQMGEPNIQAFVLNYRDITERKQADEDLEKSEKRFRALVEHSMEEISLVDPDGTLTYESPTSRRPLGYPPNSFVGNNLFDLFHPDDREAAAQLLEDAAKNPGSTRDALFRLRHQNGSWRWMEGIVTNLLDEPAVQSMVINYRDITERKQYEQEIINLAKFPSQNPHPIIRLSQDGIIMYANPASDIFMQNWGCVEGGIAPSFWRDLAAQALVSKANKNVDFICDGKYYSMTIAPVLESGYVNMYGRNINDRKLAEEKMKTSNEELSMLFELSHSLAETDGLNDILDLVNRHAVESVHTTFSRIALLEGDNFFIRAAYPLRPLEHDLREGDRYPVISNPYSKQILDGNVPLVLRADDPKISAEEKKALLLDFAQTLCLIPLRVNDSSSISGKLMGLLMLGEVRKEGREPFTPEKIRLAQTIADSATIAIRRNLLHHQTERHLQQLTALNEIDLAIISSSGMVFSMGVLLLQVIEKLKVDAADVWLFNPDTQSMEYIAGRGFRTTTFEDAEPLHLGEGYAGKAALERRTIHVPNLMASVEHPRLKKALKAEPFISYYAIPLMVNGQVKGVLEIFNRAELDPTEEWLNFLQALANQAAIAIDNSSLFTGLERSNIELTQAYDATIQGWSRALDLRDNETEGHTLRVTELTMIVGRQFGLSEDELMHLRQGALLHDIGKMGVPDRILLKPGPLTEKEWVIMRKHPTFAFELLSPIEYLKSALAIPYCHHEKWDGTGYPRGLSGTQIPFTARIFSVIDVWDALTSDRPYRKAWPEERVFEYIRSLSGIQFDPQVVQICLEEGLLKGYSNTRIQMEPVQWSEKYNVGVSVLDQQHQQFIHILNRLVSTTGTISTHSETISDILREMNELARTHFITEERLMKAYGYPGLDKQKRKHGEFRKKAASLSKAPIGEDEQIPEELLEYLLQWLTHHILEEDMAYRSFFQEKGVK